jgi:hypothetical protein
MKKMHKELENVSYIYMYRGKNELCRERRRVEFRHGKERT